MVTAGYRKWKRMLLAAETILAVAIIVSFCVMIAMPLNVPKGTPVSPAPSQANGYSKPIDVMPLSAYTVIYNRNLRKSLRDSKPEVATKAPPLKPKLNVRLIGTFLEPNFSYGVFHTKSGQQKLIAVGQFVEGAEVVSIREASVTLKFHDELITLAAEKKGAK